MYTRIHSILEELSYQSGRSLERNSLSICLFRGHWCLEEQRKGGPDMKEIEVRN